MRTSKFPLSMVPAGTSTFSDRILLRIISRGSPRALILSVYRLTCISRWSPPQISREATPGTRSMRYLICVSIRRLVWMGSRSADAPRMRIGKLEGSNFRSLGRSTSSGRAEIMRSSRSRTSLEASSRSVPQVKEMRTLLLPSEDVEEISSTPGTAARASSTGRVISSSISSGLALP